MRVLLVDDEKEYVTTLAERLALRDIEAEWALSAEEALKHVAQSAFDIAVLDVKMPHTSGIELKREIEKVAPETRFVFVTGHGSQVDFEHGVMEAGRGYYMVKPVNIDHLISKMHEVLENED